MRIIIFWGYCKRNLSWEELKRVAKLLKHWTPVGGGRSRRKGWKVWRLKGWEEVSAPLDFSWSLAISHCKMQEDVSLLSRECDRGVSQGISKEMSLHLEKLDQNLRSSERLRLKLSGSKIRIKILARFGECWRVLEKTGLDCNNSHHVTEKVKEEERIRKRSVMFGEWHISAHVRDSERERKRMAPIHFFYAD